VLAADPAAVFSVAVLDPNEAEPAATRPPLADPTDRGMPYVSIVIATRNAASTLESCLASLLAQTYKDWELVVIDGASTDGTQEILARHHHSIARWVSEPDTGIYDAWNKGMDRVHGTWIQFLGADDRLASPAVLAAVADDLHEAEGRYRVVYGMVQLVDAAGRILATWGTPWATTQPLFRGGMTIPHPGTFHHRSLFEGQRFDDSFRIAGDYEFLLRVLPSEEALFVPRVVVAMGSGGVSNRPAELIASAIESERARRLHGLGRGPAEWAPHVILLRARLAITAIFGARAAALAARVYHALLGRSSR
jgi:glycosyltransferase involved in cell wall biosynthesis